eukprot:TRINITY_DN31866_c0_g1_i1.p1 TRINITY_DN31866_c0_g1~~TRINITY_DN31866_c0_g1_i1.p1  ORF type:complete len:117 (+),score=25.46 TRINITY_DN31866_c0_g1_i1:2-352(+)
MTTLQNESEKFRLQQNTSLVVPKDKQWKFSLAFLWNTLVWLMLVGFFSEIIRSMACSYLKEQQKKELELLLMLDEENKPPRKQDFPNGHHARKKPFRKQELSNGTASSRKDRKTKQ